MTTRTITVLPWNAQGLLPIEIAERGEETRVMLHRFTPEEVRKLEQDLHQAIAERDE